MSSTKVSISREIQSLVLDWLLLFRKREDKLQKAIKIESSSAVLPDCGSVPALCAALSWCCAGSPALELPPAPAAPWAPRAGLQQRLPAQGRALGPCRAFGSCSAQLPVCSGLGLLHQLMEVSISSVQHWWVWAAASLQALLGEEGHC